MMLNTVSYDNVCFVDTETSGLDADRHEIYEVGLIMPGGDEYHWWLSIDETAADPAALEIGHYWQRHPWGNPQVMGAVMSRSRFAEDFRFLTRGMHLAGNVVSFDEERLRRLLRSEGVRERWHYHIIDVETLAAGWLHMAPPWDSKALSLALGVDPEQFEVHTALGDARWAKAIYEKVYEL